MRLFLIAFSLLATTNPNLWASNKEAIIFDALKPLSIQTSMAAQGAAPAYQQLEKAFKALVDTWGTDLTQNLGDMNNLLSKIDTAYFVPTPGNDDSELEPPLPKNIRDLISSSFDELNSKTKAFLGRMKEDQLIQFGSLKAYFRKQIDLEAKELYSRNSRSLETIISPFVEIMKTPDVFRKGSLDMQKFDELIAQATPVERLYLAGLDESYQMIPLNMNIYKRYLRIGYATKHDFRRVEVLRERVFKSVLAPQLIALANADIDKPVTSTTTMLPHPLDEFLLNEKAKIYNKHDLMVKASVAFPHVGHPEVSASAVKALIGDLPKLADASIPAAFLINEKCNKNLEGVSNISLQLSSEKFKAVRGVSSVQLLNAAADSDKKLRFIEGVSNNVGASNAFGLESEFEWASTTLIRILEKLQSPDLSESAKIFVSDEFANLKASNSYFKNLFERSLTQRSLSSESDLELKIKKGDARSILSIVNAYLQLIISDLQDPKQMKSLFTNKQLTLLFDEAQTKILVDTMQALLEKSNDQALQQKAYDVFAIGLRNFSFAASVVKGICEQANKQKGAGNIEATLAFDELYAPALQRLLTDILLAQGYAGNFAISSVTQ